MGRPLKYTPEIIKQEAKALMAWLNANKDHLWLGSFAAQRGYDRHRLAEFANKSDEFSATYKVAKAIQESRLVEGALCNKLNSRMAYFALKNVAGWRDQRDYNITGDEAKPLPIKIVEDNGKD